MLKYPKNDLDIPKTVLKLLGGYWTDIYVGRGEIEDIVKARIGLWKDAIGVWEEVEKSKSRKAISCFKSKAWQYLPLLKSKGVGIQGQFGGGANYGSNSIHYGNSDGFAWDIPSDIIDVVQIYNRITYPSVSLFKSVDFEIDLKYKKIIFKKDPFLNKSIARRSILNINGFEDYELALWMRSPKIDQKSIQQIYGKPIGLDGPSEEEYKNLVNVVYDCLLLGMSIGRLTKAIGYAIQAPVSLKNETVEQIHNDIRKVIITDSNVYFVPKGATPTVEVGDTVMEGTSLTDCFSITELKRGSDISEFKALTLGKGFINNEFNGDLSFVNSLVSTVVSSDDNGRTELTFDIGAHPLDEDRFWKMVHKKGIESGVTIAQGLDQRFEKVGEPDENSLPKQINPLRFLVDEIIPGGLTIIKVNAGAIVKSIPRLSTAIELSDLGNGLLFLFEAPLAIDSDFEVQSSSEAAYMGTYTLVSDGSYYLLNSITTIKLVNSMCS